ncbi:Nramp family divalent metal transporter [Pseudonocardia sichuanensis]
MKKLLGVALGVLTAIGGFVDIGDLVSNALVGARFGMSLAWVVVLGVGGICLFAEMAGRVTALTGRPVFDLVRHRLGPRVGLLNLVASVLVTFLTLAAEIGGVALALQLATDVHYLAWVPLTGLFVAIVLWRAPFQLIENTFGLLGLVLVVFVVALWQLSPDWSQLWQQATHPAVPAGESTGSWIYYGIALLGAAMTPYEVFFFSSGGVEERWTARDLGTARINVFLGFPLGGLLSLAIMACAAVVLRPAGIEVEQLSQVAIPVALALGKVGLAIVIIGFFAATFGAAMETSMSCGYAVAQYFGWRWGKRVARRQAARYFTLALVAVLGGVLLMLTTLDPIMVTEYSIVFAAAALPLTYFPILVVANDREALGEHVNSRLTNAFALFYLVLLLVVSVVTIPLMIATGAGGQ